MRVADCFRMVVLCGVLGAWFEINTDTISFSGTYSIPVEYQWSGVGVQLILALVVFPRN